MKSISTVVVTYNRSTELIRCINAVINQTLKIDSLVIVNNASTDDTLQKIAGYLSISLSDYEKKYEELILLKKIGTICIYIINKLKNTGGAGGFHVGLKCAREQLDSDFVWLMDDDGYPTPNCLELLFAFADRYDYIMPTSINIDNHSQLSWPTRTKNGKKTILYDELKESWGELMEYVTPFNGVLLSRKCIDEAGYVNKDFFIWGDDYEHYYRCRKKGFVPVTLLSAMFYHPAQKIMLKKICLGLFELTYSESPLRMVCLVRNWTYIYRHYNQKWKIPVKWIMYWWLFIITRRGDRAGWKLYKESVKDGFREDFSRHLQYLQ